MTLRIEDGVYHWSLLSEMSWADEVHEMKVEKEEVIHIATDMARIQARLANVAKRLKEVQTHDMTATNLFIEKTAELIRKTWLQVEKVERALDSEIQKARVGQ
jgi:hypothetical protein